MMTMKQFASNVKQHILEYLPEEFAGAKVDQMEVVKDGDKRLFGLSVKKEDSNYAPILYLEDFYQKHFTEDPSDMKDAMQEIANAYLSILTLTPCFDLPELTKESVKEQLRLRLLNTERNEDGLKDLVHKRLDNGLSLTAVMDVGKDGFARISKAMAKSLAYDENEMIEDAMANTARNHPAKLVDIHQVLFGLAVPNGGKEGTNLLSCSQAPDEVPPLMVLSTDDQFEGAVALCYPGVKEKISEVVDGSYYVLPSSIHEVLVMPDNGMIEPKGLRAMIRAVNTHEVHPSEQLGDGPLYYDAETGLLKIAG